VKKHIPQLRSRLEGLRTASVEVNTQHRQFIADATTEVAEVSHRLAELNEAVASLTLQKESLDREVRSLSGLRDTLEDHRNKTSSRAVVATSSTDTTATNTRPSSSTNNHNNGEKEKAVGMGERSTNSRLSTLPVRSTAPSAPSSSSTLTELGQVRATLERISQYFLERSTDAHSPQSSGTAEAQTETTKRLLCEVADAAQALKQHGSQTEEETNILFDRIRRLEEEVKTERKTIAELEGQCDSLEKEKEKVIKTALKERDEAISVAVKEATAATLMDAKAEAHGTKMSIQHIQQIHRAREELLRQKLEGAEGELRAVLAEEKAVQRLMSGVVFKWEDGEELRKQLSSYLKEMRGTLERLQAERSRLRAVHELEAEVASRDRQILVFVDHLRRLSIAQNNQQTQMTPQRERETVSSREMFSDESVRREREQAAPEGPSEATSFSSPLPRWAMPSSPSPSRSPAPTRSKEARPSHSVDATGSSVSGDDEVSMGSIERAAELHYIVEDLDTAIRRLNTSFPASGRGGIHDDTASKGNEKGHSKSEREKREKKSHKRKTEKKKNKKAVAKGDRNRDRDRQRDRLGLTSVEGENSSSIASWSAVGGVLSSTVYDPPDSNHTFEDIYQSIAERVRVDPSNDRSSPLLAPKSPGIERLHRLHESFLVSSEEDSLEARE